MPGEPILIVDDTPVNLKLTRILLQHEGYEVQTAASAEEALTVLESFHPRLVLADIQLPGMDGLEMTRRIKEDPRNTDVLVVALTAFAMKGDEEKARDAGCDGYITKPIDTRVLGLRIRGYLDHGVVEGHTAPTPEPSLLPEDEMAELRERFLEEARLQVKGWIRELEGPFDARKAAGAAHQWVGSGGLLGFREISSMSRELERTLRQAPLDTAELRDALDSLLDEIARPHLTHQAATPPPDATAKKQLRVLIADDDPTMLALLKAIVQSQGMEYGTVSDGPSALAAIRKSPPDAVVLDGNMPGMNGYDVIEAIRAEGLAVKILLLTADERPAACPADDYMVKPFNPIELVARLKRLMG